MLPDPDINAQVDEIFALQLAPGARTMRTFADRVPAQQQSLELIGMEIVGELCHVEVRIQRFWYPEW